MQLKQREKMFFCGTSAHTFMNIIKTPSKWSSNTYLIVNVTEIYKNNVEKLLKAHINATNSTVFKLTNKKGNFIKMQSFK